jgi:hypothetical protein
MFLGMLESAIEVINAAVHTIVAFPLAVVLIRLWILSSIALPDLRACGGLITL